MQKTSTDKCETQTKQFSKLCPLHWSLIRGKVYYDEAKVKWRVCRKLRAREASFKWQTIKVKLLSLSTPWRLTGRIEVKLHPFLTSALDGGQWQETLRMRCKFSTAMDLYIAVSRHTALWSLVRDAVCSCPYIDNHVPNYKPHNPQNRSLYDYEWWVDTFWMKR